LTFSFFMMSDQESPRSPQLLQFHRPVSVRIDRLGVRSSWNGHETIWIVRPEMTREP